MFYDRKTSGGLLGGIKGLIAFDIEGCSLGTDDDAAGTTGVWDEGGFFVSFLLRKFLNEINV